MRAYKTLLAALLAWPALRVGAQPPLPPNADELVRKVNQYPADVPLLVVERLASFQFQKLEPDVQRGHSPAWVPWRAFGFRKTPRSSVQCMESWMPPLAQS
jgi:hypothetical protein